jgi:succinate dehydrogenase / fumarate reductase flavoprotein subunit
MEQAMRDHFGLFKAQASMEEGKEKILALRERFGNVWVEDKGSVFNHNLIVTLQLESVLDVALMNAVTSLPRQESRGGHYRTDFPKMDNANFLKHSILRRGPDGEMDLSWRAVTIEDIEPEAEVKY